MQAARCTATSARTPACVLIPTHTPRHLDVVLAGLTRQTTAPHHIVVSCDSDDEAIGAVVQRWSARLPCPVSWVRRPAVGVERLCQVRNNGVRHLVDDLGVQRGRLIVLDGDMLAEEALVAKHLRLGSEAPLVYPYRVNLTKQATEALDAEALAAGAQLPSPGPADLRQLRARARRYRRHLLLRKLGLCPLHKPKLLGGHFSVDLGLYLELNGFDERYEGWGFKDDDFARRAAQADARCVVAVEEILAFHLHHPSRQRGKARHEPTADRFARRDLPVRCERGLENPLPQPPVRIDVFRPASSAAVFSSGAAGAEPPAAEPMSLRNSPEQG